MQDLKFRVEGLGCRAYYLEFSVYGLGLGLRI